MINIFVITLFQITTPSAMRGRVMSLVIALSGAAAPLGMLLGGLLGDATDKNVALIYLTCAGLLAAIALMATTRPKLREFLAWDTDSGAN